MKRTVKMLMAVLLLTFVTARGASADAYVEQYLNESEVDYMIRVAAPDGGVNFRYGPGVEYPQIISNMIPNGTILQAYRQAMASNGNYWAFVNYSGYYGWVALSQCEYYYVDEEPYYFGDTVEHACYNVLVNANDVNIRIGAGTEYQKMMDFPIPIETRLHIYFKAKASNGNYWGFTSFNGINGWVALTQCKDLGKGTDAQIGGTTRYRIEVAAPDGGVNFRKGPGTEYARLIGEMIPNYVRLEITSEAVSTTGNYWGYTYYANQMGYVTLNQVLPVAEDIYFLEDY